MNHLPFKIWEQVRDHGGADMPLGKALLSLTEEELESTLAAHEKLLEQMEIPDKVILAYHTVLMLYMENAAISRAVSKLQSPELRQALPETVNRKEAVYLAEREFNLMPEQSEILMEILPHPNEPTQRAREVHAAWVKALPPRFNNG